LYQKLIGLYTIGKQRQDKLRKATECNSITDRTWLCCNIVYVHPCVLSWQTVPMYVCMCVFAYMQCPYGKHECCVCKNVKAYRYLTSMLSLNTNKAIGSLLKLPFLRKLKLTAKAFTFLRNTLAEESTKAYIYRIKLLCQQWWWCVCIHTTMMT